MDSQRSSLEFCSHHTHVLWYSRSCRNIVLHFSLSSPIDYLTSNRINQSLSFTIYIQRFFVKNFKRFDSSMFHPTKIVGVASCYAYSFRFSGSFLAFSKRSSKRLVFDDNGANVSTRKIDCIAFIGKNREIQLMYFSIVLLSSICFWWVQRL